jgi:hypothetical protein
VAYTCECSNEPSGSIRFGEFIDLLITVYLLKKDPAPWSKYFSHEISQREELTQMYMFEMLSK